MRNPEVRRASRTRGPGSLQAGAGLPAGWSLALLPSILGFSWSLLNAGVLPSGLP